MELKDSMDLKVSMDHKTSTDHKTSMSLEIFKWNKKMLYKLLINKNINNKLISPDKCKKITHNSKIVWKLKNNVILKVNKTLKTSLSMPNKYSNI